MSGNKLRCVSIIFYSPDGFGLARPDFHVDPDLIDPLRCTEIDVDLIDPSAPIVNLDGRELTEAEILEASDHYADNDGEYEFGLAVHPDTPIDEAILYVLNNPMEFSVPGTSRFVGWCPRPTTSRMTLIEL